MIDLKPADRRMRDLLAAVTDDQLAEPTPCSDYSVADLIAHIDEAARGFAALARKDGDDTAAAGTGCAERSGAAWRSGVAGQVQALGEAWDDPAAWQGSTEAAGVDLTNETWGRVALTELVVHGWDLARATGRPVDFPEETLRACLDHVARFVPEAPVPQLWGPAVSVPPEAPLLERIVAITGRTP